ncbi:MAG: site-specific integrase [Chromatiaceae bacterium]|nr:site-specific integrase [Chromatiaceae bacterium]
MAAITLRTAKDGAKSYRVEVRLKGHPAQRATFDRLTDARKWAQATEAAIREGRHFKTTEAKRHTLAELVDRYAREVLPAKKDGHHQGRQLAWWQDELGAYALADVTPSLIVEARDRLAAQITTKGTATGPATVVRYLAVLSHAFTVAIKEWGWVEANPLVKVTKPKEPRGRMRFLSDDERERLLAACRASASPDLYPAVILALSTGARQQEVMGLRWPQVDLGRKVATLLDTKNGEVRVLPLAGLALALLRERSKVRRLGTDLVFPGRRHPTNPIDLRTPFETALKAAGIADFHWHDLRHTAASYLAMNGASLAEIAEVLGHKTLSMVKRYAHLSEAHTAAVVERMNARYLS